MELLPYLALSLIDLKGIVYAVSEADLTPGYAIQQNQVDRYPVTDVRPNRKRFNALFAILFRSMHIVVANTPSLLLFMCRLEADSLLGLGLKRHTELQELDNDIRELLEEDLTVLCISFNVLFEALVIDQCHVGRQHHQ